MKQAVQSLELFGTDGIRSKANTFPMTASVSLALGQALGLLIKKGEIGSATKKRKNEYQVSQKFLKQEF